MGAAVVGLTFYYPLFMSYVWMIGGIHYFARFELGKDRSLVPPTLKSYPPVSILVPMHNEAAHARETIAQLETLQYPDFEIVAIDDGSTDRTGRILDELVREHAHLRVVHLSEQPGQGGRPDHGGDDEPATSTSPASTAMRCWTGTPSPG